MRESEAGNPQHFILRGGSNGYEVEYIQWGPDLEKLEALSERAVILNREYFRIKNITSVREISHHMRMDLEYKSSIAIATIEERVDRKPVKTDIGFCIQTIHEVPILNRKGEHIDTERVVLTNLRGVDPRYQRRGIGTDLVRAGVIGYASHNPGYYSGRSNVEGVYASLITSRAFSEITPVTGENESRRSQQIVKYIANEVMNGYLVDPRTGLIRNAYKSEETGSYPPDLSHPGIDLIHRKFVELDVVGLNAAIYLAKRIVGDRRPVEYEDIVLKPAA